MSTIQRMSIQGIRSYGPREQDTQMIEFFTPVTLIIGQNGCGKTTIIEALKYATTSDMPPNTKGASFLFDPKLIDEIETKARIKLYFRDMSGLVVQVQKNMACTQKSKKLEFRTLETIISRYNADNKVISTITSKCINADQEVVNAFGVTKAVLEHVIFCHQEDSNWPLSDGKLLKTRFDEIFAATKYIKALDLLKKVRLEKTHLIKQHEIEKKHLETYKKRAEELKVDLENCESKRGILNSKKESIVEKIKPIEIQIDQFLKESNRIFEIKNELDKIENEKSLLEKQIKELLVHLKDSGIFQGTDEQLKENIETFKTTTIQMLRDEEDDIKRNLDTLFAKLKELNQKRTKYQLEIGNLENKQKLYLEKKASLAEQAKKICKLIELESSEVFVDSANKNNFDNELLNTKIKEFIKEYESEIQSLNEQKKQQDDEYQNKINSQRDEKSKLDQNIANKLENTEKAKKQLEQINDELRLVSDDKILVNLNNQIDKCESDLRLESKNLKDTSDIKAELNSYEASKETLKTKESGLDAKINKLHASSKFKTELDLLRKDKQAKEDQIRRIKIRINDELDTFFNDFADFKPNDNLKLKTNFEIQFKKVSAQLSAYKEKQKEIEKNLCSNEMRRKMLYDDMRAKENKLRECEDQLLQLSDCIASVDDIERYDEIFENLQIENKNLLDEKGFLSGVDKTYKRFLTQLQNNTNSSHGHDDTISCPVCMRYFKSQDELDDTIVELKKYTNKTPQKVSEVESKLVESDAKLEKMMSLKSVKHLYDKIKHEELNSIKKEVDNYDRNVLPKLRAELKQNEESLKKIEKLKSCGDVAQNEIVIIDKYANECNDLDKKIQLNISNYQKCADGDLNDDLENLELERCSIKAEIEQLNELIKSKQNEISQNYERTDRINKLKESLNELKSKKNEIEFKFQKKNQLVEKKMELEKERELNQKEINELNKQLAQSTLNLNRLSKERQEKLENNTEISGQRIKYLNDVKQVKSKMDDILVEVISHEKNADVNTFNLKKEMKSVDNEEREINSEIEACRQKLDDVKNEIARHDLKQRELMDNLCLREKRKEYEAKKQQYLKKQEELPVKDLKLTLENFKSEQRKCDAKREELLRELNEVRTNMHNLDGRIQTFKEELNLDNYKNALEKYLICASELRVLEVSVQDTEKYYKALDKAIMNYHSMKMSEINKTIKQLWRQVYRGNDIDYIEIRSEEDSAGNEEVVKARRTYNYRVVLIKGETAMDMRGRCSAGQKVLASIIIRLALAESFGLNSGILALDEPTTNLDRENIESLASALVDIIKSRSVQKNFQLIIITHDEDFVEMLGRSEYMDRFYRVEKDEKGFSRINKRNNLNL